MKATYNMKSVLGVGRALALAAMLALMIGQANAEGESLRAGDELKWFRGNTHTHTLWSDGDAAPEVAVKWYKDNKYDFLCLTDHNVLAIEEKWMEIDGTGKDKRLTSARVEELKKVFGADSVEVRENNGKREMKLKTLDQISMMFEEPGKFLLIPAEEVTAKPAVHINGLNVRERIVPQTGINSRESLKKNFEAIEEQGKRLGIPVIAHLNHPNFSDGVTAEDIIAVGGERFFEVYNGHGSVRNWGDEAEGFQSTDRLWDIILTMRLKAGGTKKPMFGMGTDDTHSYFKQAVGLANAGRGWVMVLAKELNTVALMEAMKAGHFYSTMGVVLDEVAWNESKYSVTIRAEEGVSYRTQFIGTRKGFDESSKAWTDAKGVERKDRTRLYSDEVGQVLHESIENPAVYNFEGDEIYVRAKVISDKKHPNPHVEGDTEKAWTQPVAR